MKFSKINFSFLILICIFAIIYALPNLIPNFQFNKINNFLPGKVVNLGLDLKGGSYLLLQANVDEAINEKIDATLSEVRRTLRKNKIKYKNLKTNNNGISFTIREKTLSKKTTKLLEKFLKDFQLTKKENYFVINLSDNGISKIIQSTMNQAIEIVRRRIDESGTKEPLIQQQGKDRILVQLPGVDDPGRIKRLLGKTAKLTFRFTHPKINSSELNKNFVSPPGYILLEDQNDKEKFYLIQKKL